MIETLDDECRERQKARLTAFREAAKQHEQEEKRLREDLHCCAGNFESANQIRRYLTALEKSIANGIQRPTDPKSFERWLEWAHWYADYLCPVTPTPKSKWVPTGPTNQPLDSLDVTTETKAILETISIKTTDELYQMSDQEMSQLSRHRNWRFLTELGDVLEAMGYNMAAKKWTHRY